MQPWLSAPGELWRRWRHSPSVCGVPLGCAPPGMGLGVPVLLVQLLQTPEPASGSPRRRAAPCWGAEPFRMLQGRRACQHTWAGGGSRSRGDAVGAGGGSCLPSSGVGSAPDCRGPFAGMLLRCRAGQSLRTPSLPAVRILAGGTRVHSQGREPCGRLTPRKCWRRDGGSQEVLEEGWWVPGRQFGVLGRAPSSARRDPPQWEGWLLLGAQVRAGH